MANRVCVDASLALALVRREELAIKVKDLWRSWLQSDTEIVSAPLFFAEVTSVLRESVYFRKMTPEEGEIAFAASLRLRVRTADSDDLQQQAWGLAKRYNRPKAYDAQYLAVAASLRCELWTADRRLANAIPVPWLKCVR